MKKIRKALSLTLAVLIMVSVFTVASFSVSAAETGKSLAGVGRWGLLSLLDGALCAPRGPKSPYTWTFRVKR